MRLPASPQLDVHWSGWCVGLLLVGGGRSALRRAIERTGARVLTLSTLTVRAAPDPAVVRAQLQAPTDATTWIFVSPAAVRFAWRACPDFAPGSNARVFAVGPGTASALSRRGVGATYPANRHDSEGVLAMPEMAAVRGPVALVKAPGGRALLADGLRARGLAVVEVATYRRAPARWDRRHRARLDALLQSQPRALWVATSGESLSALAQLARHSLDAVRQVPLLVSSERLSAHSRALGFCAVHVAAGNAVADLMAGVDAIVRKVARPSSRGVRQSNH